MSSSIAVGSGPIAFTDKNGHAHLIPLTAISFEGEELHLDDKYKELTTDILPWLKYLAEQKIIRAGEVPPKKPALVLKAIDAGVVGNNIQVEFKDIDLAEATFAAILTVKETHTLSYDSNSDIFIKKILKATEQPRSIVHVLDADTPSQPISKKYNLATGTAATKAKVAIDGAAAGTTAFTLEAGKNGEDGNNIVATISGVDDQAKTFVLSIVWTKTISAIKLTDLPTKLTNQYIVAEANPAGKFAVPPAGIFALRGGSDQQIAVAASVVVPSA
jgi:hypothetical protein